MRHLQVEKYYLYVAWYACPKQFRAQYNLPLTQKDFSELHSVTQSILIGWRLRPEWKEDLRRIRAEWLSEEASDILVAMVNAAKDGNVLAAKWVLELSGDYNPEEEKKKEETIIPANAAKKISAEAFLDEDGNLIMSKQTWEQINKDGNNTSRQLPQ